MRTVGDIENEIEKVERFKVAFLNSTTKANIRSDFTIKVSYGYERAAQDDWSVAEWIDGRFKQKFPGFDVAVLLKDSSKATGNMKLKNVRATYL